jgi:hypothetical protein
MACRLTHTRTLQHTFSPLTGKYAYRSLTSSDGRGMLCPVYGLASRYLSSSSGAGSSSSGSRRPPFIVIYFQQICNRRNKIQKKIKRMMVMIRSQKRMKYLQDVSKHYYFAGGIIRMW